ncbi:MAG: tetratricopeptide repeat protein, partial [Limisphaerales bacterium]
MNGFLISLLGAMLATNQVTQVSNVVARTTGISLPVVDPTDPAERALRVAMEQDDAAIADAERWINEDQQQTATGAPASATLDLRLQERFENVIKTYDEFLVRHPKHVRGRLAYGSFLNEIGRTDDALAQWEK